MNSSSSSSLYSLWPKLDIPMPESETDRKVIYLYWKNREFLLRRTVHVLYLQKDESLTFRAYYCMWRAVYVRMLTLKNNISI